MQDLPRFEAKVDSRPSDSVWQKTIWPVPLNTVLAGKYVTVSTQNENDVPELFDVLNDDALWEFAVSRPKSVEEMLVPFKSRIADSPWQPWVVRENSTNKIVGTTSFLDTSANDARTEIGATTYVKDVWATKVNPETKLLLLKYAFEELGMGRVQLKTDIRNVRSQQAIARLGATYEGVLRRYQRRADGTVRDTVLFSITVEEWPKVQTRLEERVYGE